MAGLGLDAEAWPQTHHESQVLSKSGLMFAARPVAHSQARREVWGE